MLPADQSDAATVLPGSRRQKILILGGGVGAMTTAFELTDQPGWQDKYEVTVYQLGWRLGGKGASGRNQNVFNRIEEHGLHVWGGFYDNSFALIQACYKELNRSASLPIPTWDKAFIAQNDFFLEEVAANGQWQPWHVHIPPRSSVPGYSDDTPPSYTFWDYLAMVVEWIHDWGKPFFDRPSAPVDRALLLGRFSLNAIAGLAEGLEHSVEAFLHNEGAAVLHLLETTTRAIRTSTAPAASLAEAHGHSEHESLTLSLVAHLRSWINAEIAREETLGDDLRHLFILLDYGLTLMYGILADGLLLKPFDTINYLTFVDWLSQNHISEMALNSPLVYALHDIVFAFRDGDNTKRDVEAGTMLRMNLRVMRYRGAIIYRMAAGMGDVIFAPLYEVLKRRGVTLTFFHQVKNLGLSADKSTLDTITIDRQVTLKNGSYDPLIEVEGLACWPSDPLYDQIVEGAELQAQQINLELPNNGWTNVETLILKADRDFDSVVLGISPGALPLICQELIHTSDVWNTMLDQVKTIPTQSLQLWLNKSLADLGWPGVSPMTGSIPGTQMDTWVDMYQLLARESWPVDRVKSIAYFTGVMSDAIPPDKAMNAAKLDALSILKNIKPLWPDATDGQSTALDWNLLAASIGVEGIERFYEQYFRANVEGTERYVLTLKDTTRFRLASDNTGFKRLYLAGDWTQNHTNLGMVESAVMSGMLASQALTGYPAYIASMGDFY